MKWLLISNHSDPNPGDIWVRMGVERLVRSVDTSPMVEYLERDHPTSLLTPRPFDRAVVCGMPMVWSHRFPHDGSVSAPFNSVAWGPLTTWLSESRKLIVAGFGLYMVPKGTGGWTMHDYDKTIHRISSELFSRCRLVYSRSPLGARLFSEAIHLPCPSVFAGPDLQGMHRDLKLFNAMPEGSHYPCMAPQESAEWRRRVDEISKLALVSNFFFVAHRQNEVEEAHRLGWPSIRIIQFDGDSEKFLRTYARCRVYLGNRIHGGIVARSFGARAMVIAQDSRIEDVKCLGGIGQLPSQVRIKDIRAWCQDDHAGQPLPLEAEWLRQQSLFKSVI